MRYVVIKYIVQVKQEPEFTPLYRPTEAGDRGLEMVPPPPSDDLSLTRICIPSERNTLGTE